MFPLSKAISYVPFIEVLESVTVLRGFELLEVSKLHPSFKVFLQKGTMACLSLKNALLH